MTAGAGFSPRLSLFAVAVLSSALSSCESDEPAAAAPEAKAKTPDAGSTGAGTGGTAGASEAGGRTSTGGTAGPDGGGTGGAAGRAGSSGDSDAAPLDACPAGRKRCGGFCVAPRPAVGCTMSGCDPCPTMPNAHSICNGTQCDFACNTGTTRIGDVCAPVDGGVVVVSCTNGIKDGTESDIDCGGSACPACPLGKKCTTLTDCEAGECDATTLTCTCKRLTCADVTGTCGTLSDGCNGTITCAGTCGTGVCYNGRCCTPRTKAECATNACGQVDDGCGGYVDCGTCTAPAVCGLVVTNQCSTATTCGTDSDFDGMDDCAEDNDGDPWTDKSVFNGVSARLADSCSLLNACSLHNVDALSEVENCFSNKTSIETRTQFSGWDFTTAGDQSCAASYGFQPTWTVCRTRFSVDARARINLPAADSYCFAIDGETSNQCSSFFFDGETAALQPGAGARCYTTTAGEHTVHWVYTVDTGAGNRRFRLLFCRGASCTPTSALPSSMLRLP